MTDLSKTIILDIDGCVIEQRENYMEHLASGYKFDLLPGTFDKLKEWESKNYRLILITARKEGARRVTEKMLDSLGVFYDQLIMGVGIGPRVLINDMKPSKPDMIMAEAFNLPRNAGISSVNV